MPSPAKHAPSPAEHARSPRGAVPIATPRPPRDSVPLATRTRRALALAALGLVAACAPERDPAGGPADAAVAAAESPMLGGSAAHAGVARTEGLASQPQVAWTFETGGTVRSSPALVDGVLYVGSSDATLYALDAADGSVAWTFGADGPIASSPAVAGDVVVFGDRTNRFYGLRRGDGRLAWSVETGPDLPLDWGWVGWDYGTSSPTVGEVDGRPVAVFGSGDGTLRAVDAETGEEVWSFATDRRIRATPSIAGGVVYVGGGDGIIYARSLVDGSPVWTFETAGVGLAAEDHGFDRIQVYGAAAVVDGSVFVGSRDASLYALDAATGAVRWHREDGTSWVLNTPAFADGVVYSGRSSSGFFRARGAATGDVLWEFQTGGLVFGSPTVVDELVYVASGGGGVYALERADGAVRWRFHAGAGVMASPVVRAGRVYFGSDDAKVYALEASGLPSPRLAVFFDDSLTARAVWGAAPEHRAATRYFQRYGYESLDAEGLLAFLEEGASGGPPSVVVMGMDALPPGALGAGAALGGGASSPLLRYLRAGGKVVWMGPPPGLLLRDEQGRFAGVDRAAAGAVLGVDMSPWNGDTYGSIPTGIGRAWGWDVPALSSPSATAESVDAVLAVDELGLPAVWAKSFGGPPGTGFVLVPPTAGGERLDAVRRVAEIGLMRAFDTETR